MAKQRRHASSIPKSNPKYGIGAASRAAMLRHGIKTEREYIARAVKQREDGLAKHKPPKGGTSSTRWKDDGGVVKTLYSPDGTLDRTVEISSTGTTTTWIPLEITDAETFTATASGTVDIGCGPMAFVANTEICDDPPLGDICPDNPDLCCLEGFKPELETPGEFEDFTGDTFGLASEDPDTFTGSMTYADADPLPSCTGDTLTAKLISTGGGGWTLETYIGIVLQQSVAADSFDCGTLEIRFSGVEFGDCVASTIVFRAVF